MKTPKFIVHPVACIEKMECKAGRLVDELEDLTLSVNQSHKNKKWKGQDNHNRTFGDILKGNGENVFLLSKWLVHNQCPDILHLNTALNYYGLMGHSTVKCLSKNKKPEATENKSIETDTVVVQLGEREDYEISLDGHDPAEDEGGEERKNISVFIEDEEE